MPIKGKIWLYAFLAISAFAGNSVLCRLALADQQIDPISFTIVRLISGALMLLMILFWPAQKTVSSDSGSWWGALCLFAYALLFSLAYVSLNTATGALILFGSVQLCIVAVSFAGGAQISAREGFGMLMALIGLGYLLWPEVSQPSIWAALLMAVSGVAWGFYTLNGRASHGALRDTAFNFTRCMPMILLLGVFLWRDFTWTHQGLLLAALSGAVTSGIGYAIWYAVLPSLTAIQAGVIQLLVPAIAAVGGVLFVGEAVTLRLLIASCLILGGILASLLSKQRT